MKAALFTIMVLAQGGLVYGQAPFAAGLGEPTHAVEATTFATSDLPVVNGIVRRVDAANKKVTLKHDAIPNLDMPAMTMAFAVADPKMLQGLAAGRKIRFRADEVGGVLTLMWLEQKPALLTHVPFLRLQRLPTVICTGTAATSPATNVEFEIRHDKFSTIRYEVLEGSWAGTSYIQSIGRMTRSQEGSKIFYRSDAASLQLSMQGNEIQEGRMTHSGSGLWNASVDCWFEDFLNGADHSNH